MPIALTLGLSYAFSIWMLVDAHRRGAENYWYLIIAFPYGAWIYFFLVKIQDYPTLASIFGAGPSMKCTNCRYRFKIVKGGVMCGYTEPPHFKTIVHVGYCTDYKKD